jgi:hypothetical protein
MNQKAPERGTFLFAGFGLFLLGLGLVLIESADGACGKAQFNLLPVDYEGLGLQIGLPGTLNMPL